VRGFLLDTSVVLGIGFFDSAITRSARQRLFAAPLYASLISAAEIAIKTSIGRLSLPPPFKTDFSGAFQGLLDRAGIDLLPLQLPVIEHLRHLPPHHRDPFDRLIIAQAFATGLTVATADRAFHAYDGLRILDI
jgi:PIN domain nuclease of toxin-antitoxin system